jgi:radical SAM protein with 4Fe4S-binding SPASM domain
MDHQLNNANAPNILVTCNASKFKDLAITTELTIIGTFCLSCEMYLICETLCGHQQYKSDRKNVVRSVVKKNGTVIPHL